MGIVNPGGKLPVTMPVSVGQVPCYYSMKPAGFMRDYAFRNGRYVYPFGFGLSYTSFKLNNLNLSSHSISSEENINVSVDVTNCGEREGDEVIQLYIRDVISSVTRPYKLLKRFKRITLQAGEKKKVSFTLTPEDLAFTNIRDEFAPEEGEFIIYIGTSSRLMDCLTDTITFSK
jgi:beta-glucosidase